MAVFKRGFVSVYFKWSSYHVFNIVFTGFDDGDGDGDYDGSLSVCMFICLFFAVYGKMIHHSPVFYFL